MNNVICEVCGGTDIIKVGDSFVCKSCGTKYTLEAMRSMLSNTPYAPPVSSDNYHTGVSDANINYKKVSIRSQLQSKRRYMLSFIVSLAALISLLISLITLLLNSVTYLPIYVLSGLIMIYMIFMVISSSIKLYKINKHNKELINKYLPKDDAV